MDASINELQTKQKNTKIFCSYFVLKKNKTTQTRYENYFTKLLLYIRKQLNTNIYIYIY